MLRSVGLNFVRLEFTAPRFTVYRALCEHLEMTHRIFDSSECFRQMVQELAGETDAQDEQAEWVHSEELRII